MFSTEFASVYQEILDSRFSEPLLTVYVGGRLITSTGLQSTALTQFGCQHEVGATATGSLGFLLPRIPEIDYNAEVEVQAGYNGYMDTIFSGYIPAWDDAISIRGNECKVTLRGWSELLKKEEQWDLVFQGPIALDALFVALCNRIGVPNFLVNPALTLEGTPLMMGGNTQIEEGKITFRAGSSLLSQFNSLAEPYGYFAYDLPTGHVVLARIIGKPIDVPLITFTEGITSFDQASFFYDADSVVNYWDVEGATFEDEFGGKVPIRSRPLTVVPHPAIPGDGRRYRQVSNSDFVRQDQADLARSILEINSSEPEKRASVHSEAISGMLPGHAARIVAPGALVDDLYWVRGVDQTYDSQNGGYNASYSLWAGAGETQPALNERQTFVVRTAPIHIGDEYLSHYAVPAPQPGPIEWMVTLPTRATTVNLRGLHHGSNSQIIDGAQTDLEITKWEMRIDKDSERADSTGNMPVVNENLNSRLAYNPTRNVIIEDGTRKNPIGYYYWKPFGVTFRNVDAGEQWFRIVPGDKYGLDDFEVASVYLEVYGATEPGGITEVDGG